MNDSKINVAELIESRDMAGHNEAHDAYFHHYDSDGGWKQLKRKPFHWLVETPPTLIQMGILIEMARLFPQAKVLDYGCGTGWLSRSLGYLGCEVDGVDVSEKAVLVGRDIIEKDPLSADATVNLRAIDGVRLPYPDEHFDRIVCFSAFHHVADQKATLQEMHRVLRKGGIAVFNEPGPHHSSDPTSQQEMARYGVIENNIVIEDIDRIAKEIGYHPSKIAYFVASPFITDISTFNDLLRADQTASVVSDATQFVAKTLRNIRIFALEKAGTPDSRDLSCLGGKIEIDDITSQEGGGVSVTMRWENTGRALWLPSVPSGPGSVSLGIRIEQGGIFHDVDRISLSDSSIPPGANGAVTIGIRPQPAARGKVHIGLVSEHRTWFFDKALD